MRIVRIGPAFPRRLPPTNAHPPLSAQSVIRHSAPLFHVKQTCPGEIAWAHTKSRLVTLNPGPWTLDSEPRLRTPDPGLRTQDSHYSSYTHESTLRFQLGRSS